MPLIAGCGTPGRAYPRTLIGSRALSQLHSDSMGTCTGVRPSNSLAVHCLDHGRLLAVHDPLTSSYATNGLLPMSVQQNQAKRNWYFPIQNLYREMEHF